VESRWRAPRPAGKGSFPYRRPQCRHPARRVLREAGQRRRVSAAGGEMLRACGAQFSCHPARRVLREAAKRRRVSAVGGEMLRAFGAQFSCHPVQRMLREAAKRRRVSAAGGEMLRACGAQSSCHPARRVLREAAKRRRVSAAGGEMLRACGAQFSCHPEPGSGEGSQPSGARCFAPAALSMTFRRGFLARPALSRRGSFPRGIHLR